MNDKLERTVKDLVMSQSGYYPSICLDENTCVSAGIRAEYIPNTRVERYRTPVCSVAVSRGLFEGAAPAFTLKD
jgi:hypothetical protein